jgi:hypothetical protein
MVRRFTRFAALVAAGSTALAGCSSDREAPVAVATTVRLAIVPGAHHGGVPFRTGMTQEVWHTPMAYAGDPDGTGSALITVNRGQREICWDVAASNIALPASASHIHRAAPGVQGPIALNLAPPSDNNGSWSACRSFDGLDPAFLEELVENPEAFYVNVHNATYPAGAVRGQLAH